MLLAFLQFSRVGILASPFLLQSLQGPAAVFGSSLSARIPSVISFRPAAFSAVCKAKAPISIETDP